jgi:hypothetical protein
VPAHTVPLIVATSSQDGNRNAPAHLLSVPVLSFSAIE